MFFYLLYRANVPQNASHASKSKAWQIDERMDRQTYDRKSDPLCGALIRWYHNYILEGGFDGKLCMHSQQQCWIAWPLWQHWMCWLHRWFTIHGLPVALVLVIWGLSSPLYLLWHCLFGPYDSIGSVGHIGGSVYTIGSRVGLPVASISECTFFGTTCLAPMTALEVLAIRWLTRCTQYAAELTCLWPM